MESFSLNNYNINNYEDISVDFDKIKQGDHIEKEKLVKKYLRLVKEFSTNKNGLNEDLFQELFLKVFKDAIECFDINHGVNFSTYIYHILQNKKQKYYEEKYDKTNLSLEYKINETTLMDQLKDDLDIENEYINEQLVERINELIEQLGRENKYIVKLYYGIDRPSYTLRDIADKVDLSFNGVKLRLDKIKLYLKRRLKWSNFV